MPMTVGPLSRLGPVISLITLATWLGGTASLPESSQVLALQPDSNDLPTGTAHQPRLVDASTAGSLGLLPANPPAALQQATLRKPSSSQSLHHSVPLQSMSGAGRVAPSAADTLALETSSSEPLTLLNSNPHPARSDGQSQQEDAWSPGTASANVGNVHMPKNLHLLPGEDPPWGADVIIFSPGSVPPEVVSSDDPKYMMPLPRIQLERPVHAATCANSPLVAIPPSQLASTPPMNSMGRLYLTFDNIQFEWCSAMAVGQNLILSAGHCIFNCTSGKPALSATFFDRYYNGSAVKSISSSLAAFNKTCSLGLPLYDFALLLLNGTLDARAFPVAVDSTARALRASSSGILYSYPAITQSGRIPFTSAGSTAGASSPAGTPSRVDVSITSEKGSSGGSLFLQNLPSDQYLQTPAIIGVVSYEYANGTCPNGYAAFQPGFSPRLLAAATNICQPKNQGTWFCP